MFTALQTSYEQLLCEPERLHVCTECVHVHMYYVCSVHVYMNYIYCTVYTVYIPRILLAIVLLLVLKSMCIS